MADTPKTGILMLNLGGPDSLNAVKPFLYNLFSDPEIIRLPLSWLLQKPLAWTISTWRGPSVRGHYQKMGGRSPILPLTEDQGRSLSERLSAQGHDLPVYIAMRYWHPFTEEAVDCVLADGIERLIVLPLYPQYSLTTTGSSVNELKRVLARRGVEMELSIVPPYYNHPEYQAALGETIAEALDGNEWSCPRNEVQILFSAHSLPKKFVKKTGDPYPEQTLATAQQVMRERFPGQPWELAYQSKVGNMPWLGPPTEGLLHYFAANNIDNVLIVPISFVSDHLETLYEIDMLYLGLAEELKIKHCHRARALNSHPRFIQALRGLVLAQLEQPSATAV